MKAHFFYPVSQLLSSASIQHLNRHVTQPVLWWSSSVGSISLCEERPYTTLNTCMFAATHIVPVVASVNTVKLTTKNETLRSYSKVTNCLLKKFANDQATAEKSSAIHPYTQPANITFHAIRQRFVRQAGPSTWLQRRCSTKRHLYLEIRLFYPLQRAQILDHKSTCRRV